MTVSQMSFDTAGGSTVLSVTTVAAGPVTVVQAAGDLDMDTVSEFSRHLGEVVAAHRPEVLILDLGHLDFLGAAGITALLSCADAVGRRGGHLRLRRLSPSVRLALWAARTLDLFAVEDDPDGGACRSGRTVADSPGAAPNRCRPMGAPDHLAHRRPTVHGILLSASSPGSCLAVLDDVPATGSACGVGRRFVTETLSGWGVPEDVVELAELVTSELVANAVNHAPPPGHLWVRADDQRVRIEVSDASEREPRMVRPGDSVSGGRGLLLIDRLASRWGWDRRPPGKIVWCELNLTGAGDRL